METNLESLLTENKKIFTSGCGTEFNYSWVPSIINKLYENYVNASIKLAPKIQKCHVRAKDPNFIKSIAEDPKILERHSKETTRVAKDAKEVNLFGMKIMIMALKKNNQPFVVTKATEEDEIVPWEDADYEEFIGENMSTEGQADFIKAICVGDTKDQKKK